MPGFFAGAGADTPVPRLEPDYYSSTEYYP